MIRFLCGQREVSIENRPAGTTVLHWLREDCARRGTKEGCASGDCGACTVVVVRAHSDGLRYEPVNACIATLGSLHGCQLLTVEDLADGDELHPVQRAMIDTHGSQCGFCTPGFVMSLFALYHSGATTSRSSAVHALGGNLCRCTGYRPIIDAALRVLDEARSATPDRFTAGAGETLERLRTLATTDSDDTGLARPEGAYFRPQTAAQLAALLAAQEDIRLVAGGTDLMLEVTQDLRSLPYLADIRAVPELHELHRDERELTIGAAVSHRASQTLVLSDYPELAELIERFGSLQIRCQGTIAGNLASASPIGDWSPVLLALGGSVLLQSQRGLRRVLLDEFFLGYRATALATDEFIRAVLLPRRPQELFLRAYKVSKRYEDDISSVCGVFALRMAGDRVESARLAFGGMAATPARALECEGVLEGTTLTNPDWGSVRAALARDFKPISDVRATADYRERVAMNLIERLRAEYAGLAARAHGHHAASSMSTDE